MALETVSFIDDLVITNPVSATDLVRYGAGHLRAIKDALKNSFAGSGGAILVSGADVGAVNAITITPTPALTEYTTRMLVVWHQSITNTGATTMNISGLGAKVVVSVANAALVSGDLVAGRAYVGEYDGTSIQLIAVTKNYIDQLAFLAALPAQSLGFLISDGATASFSKTHTGYAQNEVKGADIASSGTINLTTATGNLVHVTGTTTITAITIPSGADRTVVFDGILTLTHNSTTLICPSGANITTAAGDTMVVRGDGSGNARIISYQRANGIAIVSGLVLIATLTPTAAATADFLTSFTSTYNNYTIKGEGITVSADDSLRYRFAVAGTTDAGSNYFTVDGYSSATMTATATSGIVSSTVTSAGIGLNFEIRISNANDATRIKTAVSEYGSQKTSTPGYSVGIAGTSYSAANAVSGIRFLWNGGNNFGATGKIRIYGSYI